MGGAWERFGSRVHEGHFYSNYRPCLFDERRALCRPRLFASLLCTPIHQTNGIPNAQPVRNRHRVGFFRPPPASSPPAWAYITRGRYLFPSSSSRIFPRVVVVIVSVSRDPTHEEEVPVFKPNDGLRRGVRRTALAGRGFFSDYVASTPRREWTMMFSRHPILRRRARQRRIICLGGACRYIGRSAVFPRRRQTQFARKSCS